MLEKSGIISSLYKEKIGVSKNVFRELLIDIEKWILKINTDGWPKKGVKQKRNELDVVLPESLLRERERVQA